MVIDPKLHDVRCLPTPLSVKPHGKTFQLSTVCMTVAGREDSLLQTLRAMGLSAVSGVVADIGAKSHLLTGMAAWSMHWPGSTHCMVFEDDIAPSGSFRGVVTEILSRAGDKVVSLFDVSQKHRSMRAGLVERRSIDWNQCIIMPNSVRCEFVQWFDALPPEDKDWLTYLDSALSRFMLERGEKIYVANPQMVEHVGHDRSVLGNPKSIGGKPRTAGNFAGFDARPELVDAVDWGIVVGKIQSGGLSTYTRKQK